jgi:anti-anti-sigma factor
MSIKCEEYSQVCVMEVQGDFTTDNALLARKSMEDYIDQRRIIDFVMDFQKSGFIDSEGLEALLWMKRRSEDLFGQIKLANLDENCRKILQITRLDHRFEMHGDLVGALKTMR